MFNLLTSPRTARRLLGTVTDAVRSVVAPAALVVAQQPATAPVAVEPGLYTAEDMPAAEDIARAAITYDLAADNFRRADRSKRAAKKVLDKVPSGVFNGWKISRKPSARQTVDLAAVTAFYRQHGKTVPMKPCADSLVVERLAVDAEPTTPAAELVAA